MTNLEITQKINSKYDTLKSVLAGKFFVWVDTWLYTMHGIELEEYLKGVDRVRNIIPGMRGEVKEIEVKKEKRSKRTVYNILTSMMAQVNNPNIDYLARTIELNDEKFEKALEVFLKHSWKHSKSDMEIRSGWLNALLFGEKIYRTSWMNTDTYIGPKAESVSSLHFLPSADWRNNIQDCSYILTEKYLTREELKINYKLSDEKIDELPVINDEKAKIFADPFLATKNLYSAKIEHQVVSELDNMCLNIGLNIESISNSPGIYRIVEYWSKEDEIYVKSVGDIILEKSDFINSNYPFSAYKMNEDLYSFRGIGDIEQSVRTAKLEDDILNLKINEIESTITSYFMYDTNVINGKPSFTENMVEGVAVKAGKSLRDLIIRIPKNENHVELSQLEQSTTQSVWSLAGSTPFLNGTQSSSVETTAKESLARIQAATRILDNKVKAAQRFVFSEIAKLWLDDLSDNIKSEDTKKNIIPFGLDIADKLFCIISDVKVIDKGNYLIYNYKGKSFYKVKSNKYDFNKLLNTSTDLENTINGLDTTDPSVVLGLQVSDILPSDNKVIDKDTGIEIKGAKDGKWEDFYNKIIEKTKYKMASVIVPEELQYINYTIDISATTGIDINRLIERDELRQIMAVVSSIQQPDILLAIMKKVIGSYGVDIDELKMNTENKQETNNYQNGFNANNTAKASQSAETNIQGLNNVGNPLFNTNPTGQ